MPRTYSRELQAARARAAYDRSHFAPALFNLIFIETDQVPTMAVDEKWRCYVNPDFVKANTVEQNATVLFHEIGHVLRGHPARRSSCVADDFERWNIATDCEINDDLAEEGLPLPGDPPLPKKYGMDNGQLAEVYYKLLPANKQKGKGSQGQGQGPGKPGSKTGNGPPTDCGSGAHGQKRPWDLPGDDGTEDGIPEVDSIKADMVRRDVARRIQDAVKAAGRIPGGWQRWADTVLTPKVDYMAIIRNMGRQMIRNSTLGKYDRTYKRPNRRQTCYREFIMPSFYQPKPRPGVAIDTSGSMGDLQLARANAEVNGLLTQLGYGSEVIVACCDSAVHNVQKIYKRNSVELLGGGGTDIGVAIEKFKDMKPPIDVLILITDCHTPWPAEPPPFPVLTIRVDTGAPPPWGEQGKNRVITIQD